MVFMIDFTSCEVNKFRAYGGAYGNKINILYKSSSYMACHIFTALGFKNHLESCYIQ